MSGTTRIVCAALFVLLAGCGIKDIGEQSQLLEDASIIEGEIIRDAEVDGPIAAMLFEWHGGVLSLLGWRYTDESGRYRFNLTPGTYKVIAYIDSNRDGRYQPGEYTAHHFDPPFIEALPGKAVHPETLVIHTNAVESDVFIAQHQVSKLIENLGVVRSLDDPLFHREHYATGLWRPIDFIEDIGGGIFFMEAYEPDRVPVLFVHGINGGPGDWRAAIDSLDRERFQSWVYYYPSGIPLGIASDNLVNGLTELWQRIEFPRLDIVAHSMGGLVVRAAVRNFLQRHPSATSRINTVVTVNSPMAGMESAASGVRYSPIVVQSWEDVATDSDFIRELQEWSWPEEIRYHLVFSYAEDKGSDGVVSLTSQIPGSLQAEAVRMYGFNSSHTGTLSDPEFLEILGGILRADEQAQ